jgi:hypothetical protein
LSGDLFGSNSNCWTAREILASEGRTS